MPQYSGKYQYRGQSGPCEVAFENETCVVTPAAGTPVAFDLGDVDRCTPGDWELSLTLYTGNTVVLRQFGAAFSRMQDELIAAWRDRTVQCLLLEDLEEIERFDAAVDGVKSQVRLFGSNVAALPIAANPVQVRLADVDSVSWDDASYTVALSTPEGRLAVSKLAKRTEEFRERLAAALDSLRKRTAAILLDRFPFLNPDQLRQLVLTMPEGRSAPNGALASVHPKLPDAVVASAVDESLQPYFDELRRRSTGSWHAGFKFTRPEAGDDGEEPQLFFWFFFPIAGKDVVAWEATTGTGRATYFFRSSAATVEQLTRGLALINFRREPVYLPDESLEQQPKFRRYAIGARKLADLRNLRGAYVGRAIHSSVEEWTEQLAKFV
jgi:hypothetical protein